MLCSGDAWKGLEKAAEETRHLRSLKSSLSQSGRDKTETGAPLKGPRTSRERPAKAPPTVQSTNNISFTSNSQSWSRSGPKIKVPNGSKAGDRKDGAKGTHPHKARFCLSPIIGAFVCANPLSHVTHWEPQIRLCRAISVCYAAQTSWCWREESPKKNFFCSIPPIPAPTITLGRYTGSQNSE